MRINHEVGCIYDTLAFLSFFAKENIDGLTDSTEANANYCAWKAVIQNKIIVSNPLFMLFYSPKDTDSFMHSVVFDRAYSACTFERLRSIINNRLHMKKRFIAYYFPKAEESLINKLLKMDHPDVIDTMIRRSLDNIQGIYFFYTFINFDTILQTLNDVVTKVYSEIDALRRSDITPDYGKALRRETVYSKLKAITNALETNESDFTVSISLMQADLLSYRTYERDFVLLGYDFEKMLDNEYKYSDVSLYSFAQAIGNPAKYDIYNALLAQSPITSAELSMRLKLSRPTLDYNLNEMLKSRLILASPINKRTNKYSINTEYLKYVSRLMNMTLTATAQLE